LRNFLSQASAIAGQTNGQHLGLTTADMATWTTSEDWVNKVGGLTWNQATPKKITLIEWGKKALGGNLNLSGCTALTSLACDSNQLASLNVSANTVLTHLNCSYNPLTVLDISRNTALTDLICSNNPLTDVTVGWAMPPQMRQLLMPLYILPSATLHVPVGSKALYRVADVWKEFGTILEAGETGIQPILPTFEVYVSDGSIYINSPVPEQIDVYSIGGALLYRTTKPAGAATIDTTRFPQGVLIVRGSSGWVRKIVFDK
jgi:hypothetical protein